MPQVDARLIESARQLMERQVQQMVRLVDDLLDVSRITRGKIQLRKEPVELATVVARALETSRPLVNARKQELTVSLPPEPVWLEADLTRLAQVVSNLLNNAAKYTGEGGHIWLEAELASESVGAWERESAEERNSALTLPRFHTSTLPHSHAPTQVVVRVRDSGIGMTREMLARAFDLFAQAEDSLDRSQGGLGIGLTLVRSLVQMHHGSVQAFSEGPGKGSEFVVHLPVMQHSLPTGPAPRGRSGPASSRRILVVDDNIDAAETLAVLLRMAGHEVRTAHDGPAALDAARTHQPEVVLLDIGMPAMDGYEVARRVRQVPGLEKVLLVALTGDGQDADRRRSRDAGIDHHLVKPADMEALQAVVAGMQFPTP
jgi:CheY-like chemotaxis protein